MCGVRVRGREDMASKAGAGEGVRLGERNGGVDGGTYMAPGSIARGGRLDMRDGWACPRTSRVKDRRRRGLLGGVRV